jgi:predicted GNAT family acetyltransferase
VEVPELSVTDNAAEERYELAANGSLLGFIEYRDRPDARVLVHTEVDPEHEGEGLGSRLIAGALDDIRGRGLELVPLCPFVRGYLQRHPEEADLVAPRAR